MMNLRRVQEMLLKLLGKSDHLQGAENAHIQHLFYKIGRHRLNARGSSSAPIQLEILEDPFSIMPSQTTEFCQNGWSGSLEPQLRWYLASTGPSSQCTNLLFNSGSYHFHTCQSSCQVTSKSKSK